MNEPRIYRHSRSEIVRAIAGVLLGIFASVLALIGIENDTALTMGDRKDCAFEKIVFSTRKTQTGRIVRRVSSQYFGAFLHRPEGLSVSRRLFRKTFGTFPQFFEMILRRLLEGRVIRSFRVICVKVHHLEFATTENCYDKWWGASMSYNRSSGYLERR